MPCKGLHKHMRAFESMQECMYESMQGSAKTCAVCLKPWVSFKVRALTLPSDEPVMSLTQHSLAVWSGARPLSSACDLMGESLASVAAPQPAFFFYTVTALCFCSSLVSAPFQTAARCACIKAAHVGQLPSCHPNSARRGSHCSSVCLGHCDCPAQQGLCSSPRSGEEEIPER